MFNEKLDERYYEINFLTLNYTECTNRSFVSSRNSVQYFKAKKLGATSFTQ